MANTPLIDTDRRIAIGYDSGNAVMTAWRYGEAGAPLERLWSVARNHGGHLLLDAPNGLLLAFDYDHERGQDQAVIVDVESGNAIEKLDTGSPLQTFLFPAPGWNDDLYTCSLTTVSRIHAA